MINWNRTAKPCAMAARSKTPPTQSWSGCLAWGWFLSWPEISKESRRRRITPLATSLKNSLKITQNYNYWNSGICWPCLKAFSAFFTTFSIRSSCQSLPTLSMSSMSSMTGEVVIPSSQSTIWSNGVLTGSRCKHSPTPKSKRSAKAQVAWSHHEAKCGPE